MFFAFCRTLSVQLLNELMLKLSITYNQAAVEPAQVQMTDTSTGYTEEVSGSIHNIRERVLFTLKEWQENGRGDLKRFELDYYARYVEHEVIMRAVEAKWK